jgi:hypothetical protein
LIGQSNSLMVEQHIIKRLPKDILQAEFKPQMVQLILILIRRQQCSSSMKYRFINKITKNKTTVKCCAPWSLTEVNITSHEKRNAIWITYGYRPAPSFASLSLTAQPNPQ